VGWGRAGQGERGGEGHAGEDTSNRSLSHFKQLPDRGACGASMAMPSADVTFPDSYRSEFRRFPESPRGLVGNSAPLPAPERGGFRLLEKTEMSLSSSDGISTHGYITFKPGSELGAEKPNKDKP
jgi:hypothetical protein